jgi:prevent-host-death family protein
LTSLHYNAYEFICHRAFFRTTTPQLHKSEELFGGTISGMKFRTLSEAKAQLGTLVRLAEKGETVVISRHGRPAVRLAVVREEDFSLTDDEVRRLDAWTKRQRAAGRTHEYRSMDELLQKNRPTQKKSST